MNRFRPRRLAAALATAMLLPSAAIPQDWGVDWSTVDGGGEIASGGGTWSLSGTLGQPEAAAAPATGGAWEVVGGFWADRASSDYLFRDGFED